MHNELHISLHSEVVYFNNLTTKKSELNEPLAWLRQCIHIRSIRFIRGLLLLYNA